MYNLENKIVVITGGTSGIGEATAKKFALEGAEVIVAGRSIEKGNRIINEILNTGGRAIFHGLDVKDDQSIEKFRKFIAEHYLKLDILFNNAGVFPMSPGIEELDRSLITDVFDTNIVSMVMVTKAMMPFLEKCNGVIINNASVAGLDGNTSGQSYAYAASKAGVIKFTKMMAKQYGAKFRTNCICPGIIDTPIYNDFDESRFKERIPMKRVGKAEDVANFVVFMGSSDSGYMNGCVVTVDGGMSL